LIGPQGSIASITSSGRRLTARPRACLKQNWSFYRIQ